MGVRSYRSFPGDGCLDVGCSSWHHEALPFDLLAKPHGLFAERLLVPQRGVTDARQLVGQRARRLVVIAAPLHIQGPAAHPTDWLASALGHLGRAQHTTGAVGEQHADKSALELGAGEALGFNDAPVLVGHGELEHGLGKIDGNGSSMHVALLTFDEDLIPTPMKTSAPISRKQMGESIPSVNTDGRGRALPSVASFRGRRLRLR